MLGIYALALLTFQSVGAPIWAEFFFYCALKQRNEQQKKNGGK